MIAMQTLLAMVAVAYAAGVLTMKLIRGGHDGAVIEAAREIADDERVIAELVALAKAKAVAIEDDTFLDEAVHDYASLEASDINNGGFAAQIRYLRGAGWTVADIRMEVSKS